MQMTAASCPSMRDTGGNIPPEGCQTSPPYPSGIVHCFILKYKMMASDNRLFSIDRSWKCHVRRYIPLWNAFPRDPDVALLPHCTTAFAIECGKCSSRQAAMRSSSSGTRSIKGYDVRNCRLCLGQCAGLIKYDRLCICN